MMVIPEALAKKKYPRYINRGEGGFVVRDQVEHSRKDPEDYAAFLAEIGLSSSVAQSAAPPPVQSEIIEGDDDEWMMLPSTDPVPEAPKDAPPKRVKR